jgi:hypothetical protein
MNTIQFKASRAERIEQIIKQRHSFSSKIERDKAALQTRKSALINLKKHREELLARGIDSLSAKRLSEIDFSVIARIDSLMERLQQLCDRCTRETINIAVVGYARQGKSRLLRSLTGLKETVIPDGGEGYCTGTLSKIRHQPGLQEAKGKVEFYSWPGFRDEILSPYYQSLGLGFVPISVDDFNGNMPPALPPEKRDSEIDKARYGHLRRDYYSNLQKYRNLLGKTTIEIGEREIREYVTQDTIDGGGEKIVNYLAVKEVEVSCSFPSEDIGRVMLIDLPGLGDTNLIDAERIIKTLRQEADFVLFVRRPEPNAVWGEAHIKLYQIAREALSDLPLAKCSFMVLNRTRQGAEGGDNSYRCQNLQAELKETPIRVERCAIADCSSPQEASNEILEPILNYLVENIEEIDSEYARSCQRQMEGVLRSVNVELEKASIALAQYGDADLLFEQLFERFWQDLTNDLENLLKYFLEHREDKDIEFEERVKKSIADCRRDTGIPATLKDIAERRNLYGSYSTAYNEYLHETRTHFIKHFLSLDNGMQLSLESRKVLVAKALKVHLGELSDSEGSDFMNTIYTILPGNASTLKVAFQTLSQFNVSWAGKIQRQIRENLDKLRPDTNNIPSVEAVNDTNVYPPQEELILEKLKNLHKDAADKSEQSLHKMLCEPSQDAYYMVEEFVDRILRAKGVKLEWRIFMRKVSSQVWTEFKEMEKRVQMQQIWQSIVEEARDVNGVKDRVRLN